MHVLGEYADQENVVLGEFRAVGSNSLLKLNELISDEQNFDHFLGATLVRHENASTRFAFNPQRRWEYCGS